MSVNFELNAEPRTDLGKSSSRRLRRSGKVPAVIYGANQAPCSIIVEQNKLTKMLQYENFYTYILDVKIGKTHEKVVLKAIQRHPYKDHVLHLDFLRVNIHEKIKMHIPLHFVGADVSPGVKSGGVVSHIVNNIEVLCLPQDLPEFVNIDLSNLTLDSVVHLSQLQLPQGVESVLLKHGQDPIVLNIHLPKKAPEVEAVVNTDEA